MLDKLVFNNQIISNKKRIQQARVQTINKLVQKIRKLKTLSEKKPNNARITENLNKVLKIMACVKKLKISDLVRQVLLLSKKPAAIITNGQAPPGDVAVAMLASNKIMIDFVTRLRTILNLNDNNPGWKTEIMESSRRKKKLLKDGKLKKVRKENAFKKPAPWKEEDIDTETVEMMEDLALDKGWHVEPVNSALKEDPKKARIPEINVDHKILDPESQPMLSQDDPKPQQSTKKAVTTVDSFFFTETGDNYISTVVIDPNQSDKPEEYPKAHGGRRENNIKQLQPSKPRRQSAHNGRIDKRPHAIQSFKAPAQEKPAEKLHPSWAAKQKLKPTISQFKGQKITFGDDGPIASLPKQEKTPKTPSEDHLHPSWAAKQKLKPAITEFKGKKITFDD